VWSRYILDSRKFIVYIVCSRYMVINDWRDVEWDVYAVWDWDILDSDWRNVDLDVYIMRRR
jgi:hypothetical protein